MVEHNSETISIYKPLSRVFAELLRHIQNAFFQRELVCGYLTSWFCLQLGPSPGREQSKTKSVAQSRELGQSCGVRKPPHSHSPAVYGWMWVGPFHTCFPFTSCKAPMSTSALYQPLFVRQAERHGSNNLTCHRFLPTGHFKTVVLCCVGRCAFYLSVMLCLSFTSIYVFHQLAFGYSLCFC